MTIRKHSEAWKVLHRCAYYIQRASPDVSIRSKHSLTHRLGQFSPVPQVSPKAGNGPQKYTPLSEEIMRETLNSWGHSLKFNGVFTQTTAFLFSEHMLPPHTTTISPISAHQRPGPPRYREARSETPTPQGGDGFGGRRVRGRRRRKREMGRRRGVVMMRCGMRSGRRGRWRGWRGMRMRRWRVRRGGRGVGGGGEGMR